MSEAEIKRRHDYKRNRKRWIAAQAAVLVIAIIVALGSFLIFNNLNKTYYIEYTERADVDYKVQYEKNDFFDEEWIGSGQSYVSELINSISADFSYVLNMDTSNVGFNYTYDVVAELIVSDKTTGHAIYNPKDVIVPKTTESLSNSDSLTIKKNIAIDFASYNDEAKEFIKVYALKNATASLVIKMNVSVLSSSDAFESNNSNTYYAYMTLPLGQDNFSINTGTSVASGESKVLAYQGALNRAVFRNTAVLSACFALLMLFVLIAFVYATRNEDVNYTIKVQKLVRAYRSFIQQIEGDFDSTGYQIVAIKTFTEMLYIRDTIQSPVLMSENKDQTKTQFLIPTNTKLLYLFEIKVENYDELYKRIAEEKAESEKNGETECNSEPTAPVDEAVAAFAEIASEILPELESEIIEAQISESENLEEAGNDASEAADDAADESDGSIVYYDENNNKLQIKCRRSCLANIIQSENEGAKAYYSELKNHILSYKGVKARMSWKYESFRAGRRQLFKLKIRGKTVCLFCALDPSEFDVNKYYHKATEAKVYEQVPMLVRIKSPGALKRAKKLVDMVMKRFELVTNPRFTTEDYVAQHPYERTQALIDRGLIKILVPDGYVVIDPLHIVKAEASKQIEEAKAAKEAEEARLAEEAIAKQAIEAALAEPDVDLDDIDYVDEVDEEYEETKEHPGVEVVGVVWPERAHKNKIYRYDPNGEQLDENDVVLVPTKDAHRSREVVRKATVAHGNHKVDPSIIKHPLKKIIAVIKHKLDEPSTPETKDSKGRNKR